ncbi:hypothetical protein BDW62DRAFT_192781 [Aspergillus aurantiobrunneus]
MALFPVLKWADIAAALVLPGTSAWTLVWRNETTRSEVEDGQSAQNCTQIWHQEDEQFSWDPEGPWCLKFYSDPTCEHSNGITCEGYLWRQSASQNISGFSVYPMPPASVTAFGFASTSATPTLTATPTPTDSGAEETPISEPISGNDTGLSSGAIAGIVVGVCVSVAFLCAVLFYLGRRAGRKAAAAAAAAPASDSSPPAQTNTTTGPSSPPSENPSSSPTMVAPGPMVAELPKTPAVETEYMPPPVTYIQPPNGLRMMELPGQDGGAELSNTRQVQEMANTRQIQELEGHAMEKSGL